MMSRGAGSQRCSKRLTRREVEVLRGMARGLANDELARQLGISPHTLRHHVTAIYAKLGVRNRSQAILYAIGHGLAGAA